MRAVGEFAFCVMAHVSPALLSSLSASSWGVIAAGVSFLGVFDLLGNGLRISAGTGLRPHAVLQVLSLALAHGRSAALLDAVG